MLCKEAVRKGIGLKVRTRPPKDREGEASVLLVRDGAGYWSMLKAALEAQSLRVCEAGGLRQAEACLKAPEPPRMVFTAVLLADGDWERVLLLGKKAGVPVVVVSARLDARFCLATLARGAFDFIVPPFDQDDVRYVVSNASWRVRPAATRFVSRAA